MFDLLLQCMMDPLKHKFKEKTYWVGEGPISSSGEPWSCCCMQPFMWPHMQRERRDLQGQGSYFFAHWGYFGLHSTLHR